MNNQIAKVLADGKAKAAKVKESSKASVSKAAALKNDFKTIPGFPKYEINSGGVIRNIKTGNIQSVQTKSQKYQLFNAKGNRINAGADYFLSLLPLSPTNKAKTVKQPRQKVEVDLTNLKADAKEIMQMDIFKNEKIYKLHQAGYSNPEIQQITGSRAEVVSRDIWLYTSGRKK